MKTIRTITILAAVAVLALAFATSAYAQPDGGFVFGQATAQPVLSIVVGGAGSVPWEPLRYTGGPGSQSPELSGGQVTVLNDGTEGARLRVSLEQPPMGMEPWQLSDVAPGDETGMWQFVDNSETLNGAAFVPGNWGDSNSIGSQPLWPNQSVLLDSNFTFPTHYTDQGTHEMAAMISAEGVIN